jgi:hypothetical protein
MFGEMQICDMSGRVTGGQRCRRGRLVKHTRPRPFGQARQSYGLRRTASEVDVSPVKKTLLIATALITWALSPSAAQDTSSVLQSLTAEVQKNAGKPPLRPSINAGAELTFSAGPVTFPADDARHRAIMDVVPRGSDPRIGQATNQ